MISCTAHPDPNEDPTPMSATHEQHPPEGKGHDLLEREVRVKEGELELKRRDSTMSRWANPLVLAIIGATLAAFGNAYVALRNGELEDRKAEHSLVLEAIKTGNDTKQAAKNLDFLVNVGLIFNPVVKDQVRAYMVKLGPEGGPALPRDYGSYTSNPTYDGGTTYPNPKK